MKIPTSARNKLLVIGLSILFFLIVGLLNSRAGWGEGSAAANNVVAYQNNIRVLTSGTGVSQAESYNLGSFSLRIDHAVGWEHVVFWTLRSTQNAGAGTTVYSLGGLGTYNGTMVNGPTWGANGITVGTSGFITALGLPEMNQQVSMMFIGAGSGAAMNNFTHLLTLQGDTTWVANEIGIASLNSSSGLQASLRNSRFATSASPVLTNPLASSTTFQGVGANISLTGNYQIHNLGAGTSQTSAGAGSGTQIVPRMLINGRYDTSSITLGVAMTASAAFIFNSSAVNLAAVFSLYKSTLGQGLGLP